MNKIILKNKAEIRIKEAIINIQSKNYPPFVNIPLLAAAIASQAATFRAAVAQKNVSA